MGTAVWGAGAVGLLWGARLASLGEDPILVTRTREQRDRIARSGIRLGLRSGEVRRIPVRTAWAGEVSGPFERVLLTVKQAAVPPLVPALTRLCREGSLLFLFQNGMGQERLFRGGVPEERLYRAVTTEGALRKDDTFVIHTGAGETFVGPLSGRADPRVEEWIQFLIRGGIPAVFDHRIEVRAWEKLAVNCVINPLTALLGLNNGELVRMDSFSRWAQTVLDEVVRTADPAGVALSRGELAVTVRRVCERTADNRSSMLEDLRRGRPTENPFINGFVCRRGREAGVDTPLNELLYRLVLSAEGGRPHPDPDERTRGIDNGFNPGGAGETVGGDPDAF